MGKLFGTDGIRGVANETLDAKLAYRVGQAAAISLCDDSGTKPTVVIGKDTLHFLGYARGRARRGTDSLRLQRDSARRDPDALPLHI